MQDVARGAHGVFVEDLLDGRQPLTFVADFFGKRKHGRHIDAQRFGGEGLELLAKHNRVRATGPHEFHFLRRQGSADVDQLFVALTEFFGLGVDCEHASRIDRKDLFQFRFSVLVEHHVASVIHLFDPVFQVNSDATCDPHGCQKNGGDAVGASHNRGDVDEWNVLAGLFANPERHVVHSGHARRAHAHRALFRDKHHALVGVLLLQFEELVLAHGVVLEHRLAVKFAV